VTLRRAASVELDRVSKRYGSATAVDHVSLRIEAGTLVTLLGPSGCGKTTTLRMIAGLELPSEGRIRIGDKDVTREPASERDVTMVFQSYALFPHLSVEDNVGYGLVSRSIQKREAAERARAALEQVGLSGMAGRFPAELSGGQQQRVALARALVLEPEVLLLDEPLSNLDQRLRKKMRTDIRELQQRLGVTAVYVTHDQEEALAVSDRIIVMDRAAVIQEGSPRELYEEPRTLFVASFMGEANIIEARLSSVGGGVGRADFGDGFAIDLPDRGLPEGEVLVAIRPQAIALSPADSSPTAGSLEAVVESASYAGGRIDYALRSRLGPLLASSGDTEHRFERGKTVRVSLLSGRGVTVVRR
jgi:iron(III) transport system ATP-binding protein